MTTETHLIISITVQFCYVLLKKKISINSSSINEWYNERKPVNHC